MLTKCHRHKNVRFWTTGTFSTAIYFVRGLLAYSCRFTNVGGYQPYPEDRITHGRTSKLREAIGVLSVMHVQRVAIREVMGICGR